MHSDLGACGACLPSIVEISFTNTEPSSQPGCEIRILWSGSVHQIRYEISVSHHLHNTVCLL